MIPGRNDPCPCGSGKKYKKCCLGKAPQVAAPKVPEPVERRFFCVVTSYCTQAALAEALKPGGMVYIHPYALIKLREDQGLIETARLLRMWKASTLAAMPTDEIETRLSLIGVLSYDRAEFMESTKTRQSAWAIAVEWGRPLLRLSLADQDFLGLAACELWRRLCPNHPSLEMLDDWLCEGYAFVAEKKPAEALAAWWKVWETLRPRLAPDMTNLNEAGERLFPHMSQCLSNWGVDFRLEALNGSLDDARCGELGIRFIRELLASLPGEDDHLNCSGDLAMLHFHLHQDVEAERLCQRLIQEHPDRAVGYVTLSDALRRRSPTERSDPVFLRRAIHLLELALDYPVQDAEIFDLPGRLADARDALSNLMRDAPG